MLNIKEAVLAQSKTRPKHQLNKGICSSAYVIHTAQKKQSAYNLPPEWPQGGSTH